MSVKLLDTTIDGATSQKSNGGEGVKFGQSPKEQQLYFGTPSLFVMGFLQMYNSRAS